MHSKILSQRQWIVTCSTCLGYLLVHAVIVHRAQGHRLIQKQLLNASRNPSTCHEEDTHFCTYYAVKIWKIKKNVNNYPISQTHPVSLPLSISLFDIYDVLSAQEIHTPWSRDAYLGSRYPLKHSSLPSCLWLSNQARNVCVWWVWVCTYMKKQQCVAFFVLCTDCQSINNASLRKRFSPGKKIHIFFFPGLKAFWIHLTCFCLWVKLF